MVGYLLMRIFSLVSAVHLFSAPQVSAVYPDYV